MMSTAIATSLADVLFAWYEQIHQESLDSAKLHADETGWRVKGRTHWLWCFANEESCYYMTDRSRGSPALTKFFTQAFDGVLVTDFWSPYDGVTCAEKQKCWPHLLRDVASVDEKNAEDEEWKSFAQPLVRVYRDAKKLHSQRDTLADKVYDRRVALLEGRLVNLASRDWTHSRMHCVCPNAW